MTTTRHGSGNHGAHGTSRHLPPAGYPTRTGLTHGHTLTGCRPLRKVPPRRPSLGPARHPPASYQRLTGNPREPPGVRVCTHQRWANYDSRQQSVRNTHPVAPKALGLDAPGQHRKNFTLRPDNASPVPSTTLMARPDKGHDTWRFLRPLERSGRRTPLFPQPLTERYSTAPRAPTVHLLLLLVPLPTEVRRLSALPRGDCFPC